MMAYNQLASETDITEGDTIVVPGGVITQPPVAKRPRNSHEQRVRRSRQEMEVRDFLTHFLEQYVHRVFMDTMESITERQLEPYLSLRQVVK